jgi:hypothetical protein
LPRGAFESFCRSVLFSHTEARNKPFFMV